MSTFTLTQYTFIFSACIPYMKIHLTYPSVLFGWFTCMPWTPPMPMSTFTMSPCTFIPSACIPYMKIHLTYPSVFVWFFFISCRCRVSCTRRCLHPPWRHALGYPVHVFGIWIFIWHIYLSYSYDFFLGRVHCPWRLHSLWWHSHSYQVHVYHIRIFIWLVYKYAYDTWHVYHVWRFRWRVQCVEMTCTIHIWMTIKSIFEWQ